MRKYCIRAAAATQPACKEQIIRKNVIIFLTNGICRNYNPKKQKDTKAKVNRKNKTKLQYRKHGKNKQTSKQTKKTKNKKKNTWQISQSLNRKEAEPS